MYIFVTIPMYQHWDQFSIFERFCPKMEARLTFYPRDANNKETVSAIEILELEHNDRPREVGVIWSC
jgi:hypothetical protein